ncbi:hypothetical protein TPHA_0C00760 [Tetrapisispora phaffii CBS 4417]|uniref:Uncharacterized protein n=1 Tax=Tetrapisispora phaffii (strain ATCC 24235 / CBS 4417 / NBRC 1672 / NRRL Y-8282 / UCD 70-5) TaxID=1071381 RepID=G8BR56_TETPH|nr:hypothetical protein TPHA_0C00760 [Tetrapisispora phaffii CBS 4417]CCE62232.1 hypothetical protein TPHA_0C00760 [Tetrapisispora phaffii CBS 4417]
MQLKAKEKPFDDSDMEKQNAIPKDKNMPRKSSRSLSILIFVVYFFCLKVLSYSVHYLTTISSPCSDENIFDDNEAYFLEKLNQKNLAGNWSQVYTSIPHLAGQGEVLVNFTISKFEEYGLKVEKESYDVLLNYPVDNGLKLVYDEKVVTFEATLKEDELADDPTTNGDDLVQSFHGYSASGNVTAQYVYANYGTKEDFEMLNKLKVDIKDKIVIVRYGRIFRGLKVKFAQENGASGVLIYSDPGDDFYQEKDGYKAYPEGPARNPSSVQRGSVQFLSQMPGDPTTPGYASIPGVNRKDPYNSIPKIPSLPVSFKEIEPILKKLNGFGVNAKDIKGENWVGGLSEFKYFTGPNPEYTLNLYNKQSYDIRSITNVYGKLEGVLKDKYIIVGNHRDAWIKGGASDPNSGTASMLETIRGLKSLTKAGWKPERTIIFASWDGEEYALLGSTEYGENHGKELMKNCLAYINVDVSVGGTNLQVSASPSLNKVLDSSMARVDYPGADKKTSLFEHFYDTPDKKIGILGSGSDYTVFLEHLGIPSVDLGFESGENDPVYHYHSNYDSYHWMSEVMDPGFKYHKSIAQFLGVIILKLSDQRVIQFGIHDYAVELSGYFTNLVEKIPKHWLSKPLNKRQRCHAKGNAEDEMTVHDLVLKAVDNLSSLIANCYEFDLYAEDLNQQWKQAKRLPIWKRVLLALRIEKVNLKYYYWERLFIVKEGLNNRPWFRHLVFASGRDTGYEGFALPGMKEALDDKDFSEFSKWLQITAKKIELLNKH